MNPNSAHQLWSKWIVVVRPGTIGAPRFDVVQANAARFFRKAFGTTAQARIRQFARAWVLEVLAESRFHPHAQDDFTALSRQITRFLQHGFGATALVQVKARLMAGARIDGQPPDQMLMLPTLRLPDDVQAALTRRRLSPVGVM